MGLSPLPLPPQGAPGALERYRESLEMAFARSPWKGRKAKRLIAEEMRRVRSGSKRLNVSGILR